MTVRREIVGIGLGRFGPEPAPGEETAPGAWKSLPGAGERMHALADAFERLGYLSTRYDAELSAADLGNAVRAAIRRGGPDDVLVVHVLSHGWVSAAGALHVIGTDGAYDELTDVERWLRNVVDFDDRAPMTLFLLDICHAGAAARLSWQAQTSATTDRAWVIAACAPAEPAYGGRFTEAAAAVLGDLADGGLDIDQSYRHAPIATIARRIRREVARRALRGYAQQVTASLVDISAEPPDLPFFPNRDHTDNPRRRVRPRIDAAVTPFLDDLDEALDPAHFLGRAGGRGPLRTDEIAGCFSGRSRELKILAPWLNLQDEVGLRVVTGSPGVGKSALIGVLVCAAHPVLRESTRLVWEHVEQAPYANRRLAAVHARERGLEQVVASIARQLDVAPADRQPTAPELVAALAGLPDPPVVVVDALDEAVDGRSIMTELLLPLARAVRADGESVRLLVGMRPWPEFAPLRAAAEETGGLLDLDAVEPLRVRRDLKQYVSRLLLADRRWDQLAYEGAAHSLGRAVAETLTDGETDREWGAFLVAGLFTCHLLNAYEPIADQEAAVRLGASVPRTLPALLDLDLRTRGDNPWLRPVLAALAHARGDGLPAELIRQVVTEPDGPVPSTRDVLDALAEVAFYLRHSADVDGTTLYRLFHQGLADHLRTPEHTVRMLDRLLGEGIRDWALAEPYLTRHVVAHAAQAGRLDRLLTRPDFLLHIDPDLLLADLNRVTTARGRAVADAYRLAAADGLPTDRWERATALALAALRGGDTALARRLVAAGGPEPSAWVPLWATQLDDANRVTAAAGGTWRSRPLAAFGLADGTIGVNEARSGLIMCSVRAHAGAVTAVAVGEVHGRLLLVSVGADRLLYAHDVATATALGRPGMLSKPAECLGVVPVGGGRAAALIRQQGCIPQLIDLLSGTSLGELDAALGAPDGVWVDGRLAQLAQDPADRRAAVVVLDGAPARRLPHGRTVTAGAVGMLGDLPVAFVGGRTGRIQLWDLRAERLLDEIRLPGAVTGLLAAAGGLVLAGCGTEIVALRHRGPAHARSPESQPPGPAWPNAGCTPFQWGEASPPPRAAGEAAARAATPVQAASPAARAAAPAARAALDFRGGMSTGKRRMFTTEPWSAVLKSRLIVLADGSTGAAGGRVALTAVSALRRAVRAGDPGGPADVLRTAVAAARRDIKRLPELTTNQGRRTTLTALVLRGAELGLAHVGDCRAFLLRGRELCPLTPNPTGGPVQHLGGGEEAMAYATRQVLPGDRVVLCTAAVGDALTTQDLVAVLCTTRDPARAASGLIARAAPADRAPNAVVLVADLVDDDPDATVILRR